MQSCFRPLSRGLFFNHQVLVYLKFLPECFRPLSRGLFFNRRKSYQPCQIPRSFRPLSRGLFFNTKTILYEREKHARFSSPFSGTFFQLTCSQNALRIICIKFSSPFSGTFFQFLWEISNVPFSLFSSPFSGTFFQCTRRVARYSQRKKLVFVPFLGDFFSMVIKPLSIIS